MPTPTTVQARFQVRADTAANWTSANPTLLLNEIGIETDTKKLKMGDGTTAWASLAYFPSIVAGGTVLGNLEIGTTGTLTFEGSTADGFETTLAVVNPTADRTITLPNATGTVILNTGGQTIEFGAGAVGTPSITTTGDLDTGIWFPAANTTAISTAGSERLRIDSSGRVGIGTTNPSRSLQVTGANAAEAALIRLENNQASGGVTTQAVSIEAVFDYNNGASTGNGGKIYFGKEGTYTTTGSTISSYLAFQTVASNSQAERLRIESSGRLLINTSTASTNYYIGASASTPQIQLTGTSNAIASMVIHNQAGTGTSSGANAGRLHLVGGALGTTSNSTNLVANDSIGQLVFSGIVDGTTNIARNGASIQAQVEGVPTTTSIPTSLTFSTTASSSVTASERMRIDSSGRVGIGDTTPDSILTVTGGAIRSKNVAGDTGFDFHENGSAALIRQRNNRPLLFYTNNTEAARIDSSGRLLVGTSNAESFIGVPAQFQIQGTDTSTARQSIFYVANDASGPNLTFAKARTTGKAALSAGDELGTISFLGSDGVDNNQRGAEIGAYVDGGVSSNDLPSRLVFSTTADGASSPTERLRITNDGVRGYNQAAPVAVDATATLTVANLKNGIITSTTAAAVTGTLPTGTLTEGGFSGLYNNFTFEWTVINTGATNNFTVAAGTDHTVVGNMVVAAGNSGRFATRRTAANTFVTYRLSS